MQLQVHSGELLGSRMAFLSGNYSTFEEAHEKDQQHRAELAQRQQDKQEKVEKQIKDGFLDVERGTWHRRWSSGARRRTTRTFSRRALDMFRQRSQFGGGGGQPEDQVGPG